MQPPPEPKSSKRKKAAARGDTVHKTNRGQPRPYRKLTEEVLASRITKLTSRLERAKKQVRFAEDCPPPSSSLTPLGGVGGGSTRMPSAS